jgi:hypothetical protein
MSGLETVFSSFIQSSTGTLQTLSEYLNSYLEPTQVPKWYLAVGEHLTGSQFTLILEDFEKEVTFGLSSMRYIFSSWNNCYAGRGMVPVPKRYGTGSLVLQIQTFVRIRICGSIHLTNGSVSESGSGSCYFRQ